MTRPQFRIRALLVTVLVIAVPLGLLANAWKLLGLQVRGPYHDVIRAVLSVAAIVMGAGLAWFFIRWARSRSKLARIREERMRLLLELKSAGTARASESRRES